MGTLSYSTLSFKTLSLSLSSLSVASVQKIWILIIYCAATGTVSTQVIEDRGHEFIMCGLNRFFVECGVPKVMYPDMEGGLMKALNEGELGI